MLAYLVAAVLHGFNDGVIAGPITAINGFLAVAVSSVYILLIYIFWMRPQYARLTQAG